MSAPLSRRILSSLITPFTTTTSTYQSSISRLLHLTPSSFVVLDKMQANSSASSSSSPSFSSSKQQIQTFVVCGPSGSGKTTLLSMLTDFYKDCFKFCVSRKRIFLFVLICFNNFFNSAVFRHHQSPPKVGGEWQGVPLCVHGGVSADDLSECLCRVGTVFRQLLRHQLPRAGGGEGLQSNSHSRCGHSRGDEPQEDTLLCQVHLCHDAFFCYSGTNLLSVFGFLF